MKNNRNILVVDDELIVAVDIKKSLKALGYCVVGVATTGMDAVNKCESLLPDLVLMDIVLKGEMTGIESAEIIRNRFDIPVVYLTAHTDEKTVEDAKVTEPFGFIVKPYDHQELQSVIELALYKHSTDQNLRKREAWFSTTFRSIGNGVIVTDKDLNITFMNPYAIMLTGWNQKEALGKKLSEVFTINDERTGESLKHLTTKILKKRPISEMFHRTVLRTKDERDIPIDNSIAPVKGSEGGITGVVVVFHDTLDRKLAEEALKESEERYRSIFEESRDAIYITTRKGNFVIANQSMLDMFGYNNEEIVEMNIGDFFVDSGQWEDFRFEVEEKGSVRD